MVWCRGLGRSPWCIWGSLEETFEGLETSRVVNVCLCSSKEVECERLGMSWLEECECLGMSWKVVDEWELLGRSWMVDEGWELLGRSWKVEKMELLGRSKKEDE